MHPVSKFPKAFFFGTMLCILCPCMSQHSCFLFCKDYKSLRNLSRQVMNIKSRMKLANFVQSFRTLHQYTQHIPTAREHELSRFSLGKATVLCLILSRWERETVTGCFKLSQTLKRKIMFYFISEAQF